MTSLSKPKIAFFDFAGCEGCQLTVIDALQTDIDLLNVVEIVQFREAMSEKGDDYTIAFIEGSYTRFSDKERLIAIRDQAEIVIALGACAHLSGINAIRNLQSTAEVRRYVYGDHAEHFDVSLAKPISAVIHVDAFIPGCPIDRQEFVRAVKALLQGNLPDIPDYPVCVECKLKENSCLFWYGKTCQGPITRAGCGALCPSLGTGCVGCRGLIPSPNISSFKQLMSEHGTSEAGIEAKLKLFMTHEILKSEASGDGN
ncbi:MAG TPA: NADH:ubiquinone oxidoreductase [Anaerolineae bacterium]|nr:NADH:ubiquinone oxidoreductase [Anaerolineae bacterium]